MKNLVTNWKAKAKLKYGNITKGVDRLNTVCNRKMRVADISAIERGQRNLSSCANWLMLNDTLEDTLEKYGIEFTGTISSVDWVNLISELTPPERK